MDLSVFIVSYNTRELVKECLASIFENSGGIKFEVIVVDNGSSDGTVEVVRSLFPQARLIANDQNLYFTKANNQALRVSRGRYILILNSDTRVEAGTLPKMVAFMDAQPHVGGITCRLVDYQGNLLHNARRFHTPLSMMLRCEIPSWVFRKSKAIQRYLEISGWDWQSVRTIDVAEDSCFLVRREALDEIGLYDERLLLYYTEDDLCQRLRRAGWLVMYYPDVQVVHGVHQTARRVGNLPILKIRVRDQAVYCRKYLHFPWSWLVILVSWLDLSLVSLFLNVRSVWQRAVSHG
jgi:GT2 family glycosyltransferase